MNKKQIPTGIEEFNDLILGDFYYVDKTDIIDTMLNNKKFVYLFPRPRRFGKSLFISMLDNFFNIEYKEDNKDLFKGLKIEISKNYKDLSTRPVIRLNFKEINGETYGEMYNSYRSLVRDLYISKEYLLEKLSEAEQRIFNRIELEQAGEEDYKKAIKLLSGYMKKYYGKKVVILIDEYDAPIQDAYVKGFYDDFITLIRAVFANSLKNNPYAEFSVMTGVLRVSKESLFSELNNVTVYGIVEDKYNEAFGFTESETKALLNYYDLKLTSDVKRMYDGYNFNGSFIYNPWSILNYADGGKLIPHWVNTSSNDLLIKTIKDTEEDVMVVIESLLSGESIIFRYNDKITYLDYNDASLDNILNLLFTSGYLTLDKDTTGTSYSIKRGILPNEEVKWLFNYILGELFTNQNKVSTKLVREFTDALINNNKELIENILNKMLPNMSYMDESEKFYHGYMLGLFSLFTENGYNVKSNREAGSGRFDLMIEKNDKSIGMILELKITDNEDKMEDVAKEALNQIETKEYYEVLVSDKVKTIYKYAIIFKGKKCIVR